MDEFCSETSEGYLLHNLPDRGRVKSLKIQRRVDFSKESLQDVRKAVTGKPMKSKHFLPNFTASAESKAEDKLTFRRNFGRDPLLVKYRFQAVDRGEIDPLEKKDLPKVLYHAAYRNIRTAEGDVDQLQRLMETGLIGPKSSDDGKHEGRFYLAASLGFALKELPRDSEGERGEVMVLVVDPAILADYRDVYPDPESVVIYAGEFRKDFAIIGQLPGRAVREIQILEQEEVDLSKDLGK